MENESRKLVLEACKGLDTKELDLVLEKVLEIKARRACAALSDQFEPAAPPLRRG